ncbi:MAG TPA: threonine synthase [Gaiellaceae bacterium]|nr:threonine synthase [Gaiellaceae bacterium]
MNGAYHLRCRVCEEVTEPVPAVACHRCDGPTDVAYDWDRLTSTFTREAIAGRPETLWRYAELLPSGARVDVGAGRTRLVPCEPLSDLLELDLYLKLESENPTRSYKDRVATIAVSAALDHGVTTVCCSSTGNLGDAVAAGAAAVGLEAIVLVPEGSASAAVEAGRPGVHVLAVRGTYDDCRRLELELGSLFPWGFVSGNLHPYASEGAKTISFEIAEQLGWRLPDAVFCPAASGTLHAKLTQGFAEVVRAGLAPDPVPRMFAAQALGSSPIADAFADDRSVSRVRSSTGIASLAVGNPSHGDLALGAARATSGAIVALAEDEIAAYTELLSETTGVSPDPSGGAALGALITARRGGLVDAGSEVVLVVTGRQPRSRVEGPHVVTVDPDAADVLGALGLAS